MNQWLRELRRRRRVPGRRPSRPSPGARWRGWARSLTARRQRAASSAWRLRLTLRQASGPAVPASAGRRTVLPALRIQLVVRTALNAPPGPVSRATAAASAHTAVTQARPGGSGVAARRRTVGLAPAGGAPAGEPVAAAGRAVVGDVVTAAVRHTVQRIVERGQRVEERTAAPDPASGLSGYPHRPDLGWTPGPPPTAAARLPQYPALEHGHGVAAGQAPGTPGPRRTTDPPPEQPRIDVGQLADQVVRRIDDRIIAHRERLGRI